MLAEISDANLQATLDLSVHHSQRLMVAPVAVSLSAALILDGEVVGRLALS